MKAGLKRRYTTLSFTIVDSVLLVHLVYMDTTNHNFSFIESSYTIYFDSDAIL